MEQFSAAFFFNLGASLLSFEDRFLREFGGGDISFAPSMLDQRIHPPDVKDLTVFVADISQVCEKIGLRQSVRLCADIYHHSARLTHRQVSERIGQLRKSIMWEMGEQLFLYVPLERAKRYSRANSFGEGVARSFSGASFDIQEAGTCFAAGRYTACVFHLMRVLEIGLTVFADTLRVSHSNDNWQQLIEGIEKKLRENGRVPRTADEKTQHEQFCQAASSFMILKDAWRNYTAHARGIYTDEQADAIYRNVEAFMQKLAGIGLREP